MTPNSVSSEPGAGHWPVAVAPEPFATAPEPVAVANKPFAVLNDPVAVAALPVALAVLPKAVAAVPAAVAFAPTAVDCAPVEAAAAQDPVRVPTPLEKHCAKAGEAPNTVAIPAATASERTVPPAMALAPMRRARKLSGMPGD
jgi:hypothetical protein